MSLRQDFETLREATSPSPAELDRLWERLRPVTVETMLGQWVGGDFNTGHPASTLLQQLRWHGKRFDSVWEGHPLICRDADGGLYSETRAAGGGYSSLWAIEFRGEVTATMVYDSLPVFDHFKAVDTDTVMGIMSGKLGPLFGTDQLYYFWLTRQIATP